MLILLPFPFCEKYLFGQKSDRIICVVRYGQILTISVIIKYVKKEPLPYGKGSKDHFE